MDWWIGGFLGDARRRFAKILLSIHPIIRFVFFGCGWRRGLKQEPTTVASRGFLSNFRFQQEPTASLTTTTTRMTTCELIFNI
jgi:hypothetical protein